MGATEVLKGKLTRNPELVEHGREKSSGILQKKEQEALVSWCNASSFNISDW